jgi:hypothetical protein
MARFIRFCNAFNIRCSLLSMYPNFCPGSSQDPDNHEAKLCRSPLAGIVVHVPVAPRQQLQVNDLMVLLEAMKMETAVTAPVEGKLRSVNVVPGESVKVNQVLVEFDGLRCSRSEPRRGLVETQERNETVLARPWFGISGHPLYSPGDERKDDLHVDTAATH